MLNPSTLPEGMDQVDYSRICTTYIDCADCVFMLNNWEDSLGARAEKAYAQWQGKQIWYQE